MYRDDREATDALAAQLRRDNATLEEENARLKAELAKRPALSPTESRRARKQAARAEARAKKRAARAGAAPRVPDEPDILSEGQYEEAPVREWTIRVLTAVGVAAIAFQVNAWAYPRFNRGLTGTWMGVFSAATCQLWSLFAVTPSLLGWWPVERGRQFVKPRTRVLAFLGGLAAVVITALFGAFVGESSGGD